MVLVLSVLVGLGVGVLSGMFGIGGGMVMVPVFSLFYGMAAVEATATSLFVILPTSLAGCVTHLRKGSCIPLLGVAAGLGGACTSWIGVRLANASPSWAVILAAAALIAYSSYSMLMKARGMSAPGQPGDPAPAIAASSWKRVVGVGFPAGLAAGIASGYVGVGGGFIMVPIFVSILGVSMKKASGTSLIAVSILAVPGIVAQMLLGNVFVGTGIAVAIGGIPGAVLGASLVKRVPEQKLRYLFSGLLLLAAVSLLAKEVGI